MTFICGGEAPDGVLRVLAQLRECCSAAFEDGPQFCTCWEPAYELEQTEPRTDEPITIRRSMCDDCAYRPDSQEAQGDPRYKGRPAPGDGPFWCHTGMRKPIRWRHRSLGITVEADGDFYKPPKQVLELAGERLAVPFRATGQPGLICAGWAAHYPSDIPDAVSKETLPA